MVRRQDVPGFGWQRAVGLDSAWVGRLARAVVVLVAAPAAAALAVAVWPLLGAVLVLAFWVVFTAVSALIAWPALRRAGPWLGPALRRAAGWAGVGLVRLRAAGRRHWEAAGPRRRRPSLAVAARTGVVGAGAYRVRDHDHDHGHDHGQDHGHEQDNGPWATGEEWAA